MMTSAAWASLHAVYSRSYARAGRLETQVRQCRTKILTYSLRLGKVRDAYTGGSRPLARREDDRHSAQRRTSDTLRMRPVMLTSSYSPRGL